MAHSANSTVMTTTAASPSLAQPDSSRAAAAAARRKRRKVVLVRKLSRQKRVQTTTTLDEDDHKTDPRIIPPTVEGMQQAAAQLAKGHVLALPTECTYEVAIQLDWREPNSWSDRIQQLKNTNANVNTTSNSDAPDSPPTGLFPHLYLHHPSVLEGPFWRKCWPKRPYAVRNKEGEVLAAHAFCETLEVLKLLLSKTWPGPAVIYVACSRPLPPGLTVHWQGQEYLALRSLCHPLMVRVYQEYCRQWANQNDDEPVTVYNHASPLSSSSCPNTAGHFLMGMALNHGGPVTTALQVPDHVLVLHGEECREIFAVPTCEYGQPSTVSLWVDAAARRIICRGAMPSLQQPQPKTGQDRVIQAVLNQWKVIQEG